MRYGIAVFPADYAADPATIARLVEERGFESLFFPEHTHIPASRKTPYPAGGDLPREYYRTHDPFVALALAAGVTKKLRLATGICLVVERVIFALPPAPRDEVMPLLDSHAKLVR